MNNETPVDYHAALEHYQKEEHAPGNPVHSPDKLTAPPKIDGYVDYEAVINAWDKEQTEMYKIHLHNK